MGKLICLFLFDAASVKFKWFSEELAGTCQVRYGGW